MEPQASSSRLDEAKKLIDSKIKEAIAKLRKLQGESEQLTEGQCDTEQALYDALVASAAQKFIIAQDKQAEADAALEDYNDEEMLATAAGMVLWECLHPT